MYVHRRDQGKILAPVGLDEPLHLKVLSALSELYPRLLLSLFQYCQTSLQVIAIGCDEVVFDVRSRPSLLRHCSVNGF